LGIPRCPEAEVGVTGSEVASILVDREISLLYICNRKWVGRHLGSFVPCVFVLGKTAHTILLTDAYINKMLFNTNVYISVLVELNLNTTEIDSFKILCWSLVQCCQTEIFVLWIQLKVRSVSENTMSPSRKALFSTPTTLLNQLLHIPFSIENLSILHDRPHIM
jgi:hypothetical protein